MGEGLEKCPSPSPSMDVAGEQRAWTRIANIPEHKCSTLQTAAELRARASL